MMRMSSFILFIALTLLSCTPAEPTIEFGKAECAHCRMNVVDRHYGAALVTEKGRQYVFDDVSCMVHFVAKSTVAEGQVKAWYVCDHATPGTLIDATAALYLHGPAFRSPMRGDVAAFGDERSRNAAAAQGNVQMMDWKAVRQLLAE